jgi:TatD DNase family protein
LEAACQLNLPVIFHERDSSGRLIDILNAHRDFQGRGVIHCFSGTPKELHGYLDMGCSIGITGVVTLKERGTALREMVPIIPADRLLIETDAPYLTPSPQRNSFRRNEPAFVASVLFKLAAIRRQHPEILAEMVWKNTCRLFGIQHPDAWPRQDADHKAADR